MSSSRRNQENITIRASLRIFGSLENIGECRFQVRVKVYDGEKLGAVLMGYLFLSNSITSSCALLLEAAT
ncbi:hypothetical protein Agabi119p4_9083 [Agaricus bisporus var. burnettii]|uniref:Uncharacterized protein n=1 Tax=Agaricus bisporus var. burnettii TaxID=192524 RepID=A0A8H7EYB3_AGABI|nr:hypothetical protein Agabi119p4_9083 [Agaricus bisporus var. burnettii]